MSWIKSIVFKMDKSGIRVVGKGSWKEREVGKFEVGKPEVGKFLFKLERAQRNWKFRFHSVSNSPAQSTFPASRVFQPNFPT